MIVRLVTLGIMLLLAPNAAEAVSAGCAETSNELLITYRSPSGPSNDVVFHVDRAGGSKTCAKDVFFFVNGEAGMVGPITVNRIEPDQVGCRPGQGSCEHGWQINQCAGAECNSTNPIPPQCMTSNAAADINYDTSVCGGSLPQAISDGSVMKARSVEGAAPGCRDLGCIQQVAVLTVTTSRPPNPGDTFRPPHFGLTKPSGWKTLSGLDFSGWSRIDCSSFPDPPTFGEIKARFSQTAWHIPHFPDRHIRPKDFFLEDAYHGASSVRNAVAVNRMNCNDFDPSGNPEHKAALVGYLQYGFDLAWWYGPLNNWPSNSMGQQIPAAVFAHLSRDSQLISNVRGSPTNESRFYYTPATSKAPYGGALWGRGCTEDAYWSFYDTGKTDASQCRDPYGVVDGPYKYMKCCSFYQGAAQGALAAIVSGVRSTYDRESLISFAYRNYKVGYWGNPPDPCLKRSAGGGSAGGGACKKDPTPGQNPRVEDDPDGAPQGIPDQGFYWGNGGSWGTSFAQAFKQSLFDCAWNGTCSGLNAGLNGGGGNSGGTQQLPTPYLR